MKSITLTKAKLNLIGWALLVCNWIIYSSEGSSVALILLASIAIATFIISMLIKD